MAVEPAYAAVLQQIRNSADPVIDAGCGIGLLPFYLRAYGFGGPIIGIDHDERKIEVARAANQHEDVTFMVGDLLQPLPCRGHVVMLDVLHYFTNQEQAVILSNAARAVIPGGALMLRDGLRDGSWKYRATYALEALALRTGWLKAARLNFPTRDVIEQPFANAFNIESCRLSGPLPLNNHFFVFRPRSRATLASDGRSQHE